MLSLPVSLGLGPLLSQMATVTTVGWVCPLPNPPVGDSVPCDSVGRCVGEALGSGVDGCRYRGLHAGRVVGLPLWPSATWDKVLQPWRMLCSEHHLGGRGTGSQCLDLGLSPLLKPEG